tara:strand:- start:843 stop:1271 length:429 start_codon:yes stop_codon:yes gene_type:complete
MEKEDIKQLMRESLRSNFRFFEEQHQVNVYVDERVSVSYRTSEKTGKEHFTTTFFDIQLIGDICYLLDINLEESLRGQGAGWEMYETVHQFAKIIGSTSVRQFPSGWPIHDKTRTRRAYLLDRGYHNLKSSNDLPSEVELIL